MDCSHFIFCILIYIFSYFYYRLVSHGLGHKAEYLQLRRFIPCAILAVLPAALADIPLSSPWFVSSLITGISWIITYPLFYFLTNRKVSSDFGFHFDTVFGLYVIGWLTSLKILVINFNILPTITLLLIATVEFLIFSIPFAQWIYYYLYHSCISEDGMNMIQDTDYNEIIEFFKQFSALFNIVIFIFVLLLYTVFIAANINYVSYLNLELTQYLTVLLVTIFLSYYLWKNGKTEKQQGPFIRTGLITLWMDVKEYKAKTLLYQTNMQERIKDLTVVPEEPQFSKPSTIIMVIGESASRDYMSAFVDYPVETTPWLSAKKQDRHFILYPNAYSCVANTVSCLERALTEFNQYNDKQFYTSCSVIDIAHKAGYTTYWYSNQGHLGCADTPVTLVANTCDTAKWTKQNLNQQQYDENLLDYLKEINPQQNNFIVLHLMGNHFNFINRYPQSFAKFSKPGKYDLIPNYIDSIRYTDYILQKIWEYGTKRLNLQAMLYFSDHAAIPDKRRSPNFDGFGAVRIPMFTYFSDEYINKFSDTFNTLKNNQNKYFTNDLIYELACGILNIKSNHCDETNSLASRLYKYTRENLKTGLGQVWIKDDNN